MTREWKPGDVVTGLLDGIEIVGIVRGGGTHMFYADSVTTDQVALKHVRCLRPLVVIDPEDREQVERLALAYVRVFTLGDPIEHSTVRICANQMQQALREFADPKPPKPEEPLGLGAVVETPCGKRYVRQVDGWWRGESHGSLNWAALDVFRVLSEGVQT